MSSLTSVLSRFGHLAGFNALGADSDVLNRSRDDGPHALQIGIEPALGSIIGVADPVAGPGAFATHGTTICHNC
jgi:hypothetical protein